MTSFKELEQQYGERLQRDFANVFGDVTPNPKGAKPSREVLYERAPPKGGES